MINLLKINDEWLPTPDGDLKYKAEKVKSESESEAGTTLVIVTRVSKLEISGKWNLSGKWMKKFREYRDADTVTVEAYYPNTDTLTAHECQFEIASETHISGARKQLSAGGLYEVDVDIKEI